MKKKLGIILFVFILLGFLYIKHDLDTPTKDRYNDDISIVETRWKIQLPSYKIKYQRSTAQSFGNDGLKYFILELEDNKVLDMFSFASDSHQELEDDFDNFWEFWDSPETRKPLFDKPYHWCIFNEDEGRGNKLYLLYFPESQELHVLESLI